MRLVGISVCLFVAFASGAEWGYEGEHGPDHWGAVCNAGKSQSPIDIPTKNIPEVQYSPFVFLGYDKELKDETLLNNGHTVQMGFGLHKGQMAPTVVGGGLDGTYEFAQYHLHWGSKNAQGSEHIVDSTAYPMELHLVHFKKEYGKDIGESLTKRGVNDNLAVLGIFFQIEEKDNPALEPMLAALKGVAEKDEKKDMKSSALKDFLPRNTHSFYRYSGSLTTPGCNEVVVWTVFKDPIGISASQMEEFRKLNDGNGKKMVNNYRPPQPLNDRQVLDVETSNKKFHSSAVIPGVAFVSLLLSIFVSSLV